MTVDRMIGWTRFMRRRLGIKDPTDELAEEG
jgi:hypothetical protein